jgi:very-short-patch-repair endonuclease
VNPPSPFESWFEVDVALELLRRDFTVVAQYEFAGKRIDIVVEGGRARLAVECDGDQWHGVERYEADMHRQRQLERCGWEFFRVSEATFYANKHNALSGLWEALEERHISPNSQRVNPFPDKDPKEGAPDMTATVGEESLDDDETFSADESASDFMASSRRTEDISSDEIQNAILQALEKCPNYSCTLHSLTARVLKELGVLTRGKPRETFERRTVRAVSILEKRGLIETYKAKNRRLRLLQHETT